VSKEDLGGAVTHNTRSGVAHFMAENGKECLRMVRELLSYVPSNNLEDPPFVPTEDPVDRADPELKNIVPDNPNKPYDMSAIIKAVVDDRVFFEVQREFGKNILIGFARLGGRSVGIVANQPAYLAGCPTSTPRSRRRASSASATASTSRSSPSSTCRDSCRARPRSTAGSSSTGPSCSTPSARQPSPR
jgi:acetyl-CoA carboxylase carboxyltransferase component